MRGTYRGKTIGWGPTRADWHSICSIHHPSRLREDCHLCMVGRYVNRIAHLADVAACRFAHPLWSRWKNRPRSKTRRFLEDVFPNLRRPRG